MIKEATETDCKTILLQNTPHEIGVAFAEALLDLDDEARCAAIVQLCWDVADACEQTPIGDAVAKFGAALEKGCAP